jgi:hypothetical protein
MSEGYHLLKRIEELEKKAKRADWIIFWIYKVFMRGKQEGSLAKRVYSYYKDYLNES